MTIATIILCIIIVICIIGISLFIITETFSSVVKGITIFMATVLCISTFAIGYWYNNYTASGKRAFIDQKSELNNGIERIVTIYTANGDIIAQYKGKIDIDNNDGYVKFDFNGRRYIYYNCFVESITEEVED